MPTHINPQAAWASAPPDHKALFEHCDVFSMYRRWFEQQAFTHSLLQKAGFHGSLPYKYEQEQFADMMEQKRSDVQELATLKAGLWWYYEGYAGGQIATDEVRARPTLALQSGLALTSACCMCEALNPLIPVPLLPSLCLASL